MIDAPQIASFTEQLTAVIHLKIAKDEIRQAMGPAMKEVMSTLAAQDIKVKGPMFTHHFTITATGWDFEVGVPVDAKVAAKGRVRPSTLPSARVARTSFRGPYEELGDAWGEFREWLKTHGHQAREDLWEVYARGPESGPDPRTWCTELHQPLVD